MTPARERLVVVLAVIAVGGGIVLTATRTFATVSIDGFARPVVVSGQQAAPALAPLGLVALALAGVLTIAGRGPRLVLGAVLVLLGAAVAALLLPSLLDPAAGTAGAVTKVTLIEGSAASSSRVVGTAWPAFGLGMGVLVALLGIVVLVRSRRWSAGGRRYRRTEPAVSATDPISEWDSLTRGTDPTDDRP